MTINYNKKLQFTITISDNDLNNTHEVFKLPFTDRYMDEVRQVRDMLKFLYLQSKGTRHFRESMDILNTPTKTVRPEALGHIINLED